MSDKEYDDQEFSAGGTLRSDKIRSSAADDSLIGLNSEALAHLQIQWEQFSAHVRLFKLSKGTADQRQLIDDLMRVRNTLVVLEKPALELVVRELLAVFDNNVDSQLAHETELATVLFNSVIQIGTHLQLMQKDVSVDNALALVPLINDCRASKDDMLISDSLMLAAGVQLPAIQPVSVTDALWSEQREIWVDYASSHHTMLAKRLLHWWRKEQSTSVSALVRELDGFAILSAQHVHLNALTPLFQSASVVVNAVHQQQLDDGPALRSLFVQLEQHVHRCTMVALPEDLIPGDLFRNFLYYVAQTWSDSDKALELLRRFRLDRVRHVALVAQTPSTPTIGVVYHLTNAIRIGFVSETESLREWLDSSDSQEFSGLVFIRLRVRLGQLESILTLMGNAEAVQCLKSVQSQLQMLSTRQSDEHGLQSDLSQSLFELDSLLEQSARRSVLRNTLTDSAQISGEDVYFDMATDACLREARNDLQQCADDLLPMVQLSLVDAAGQHRIIDMLRRADSALQILPLPEVSPLFEALAKVLNQLFHHAATSSRQELNMSIDESGATAVQLIHGKLGSLLASLDSYLGCVLHPQPAASQFLTDAEEMLEELRPLVVALSSTAQDSLAECSVDKAHSELWLDDTSLLDIGSLTLNVDDDLLLEPLAAEENSALDSTLQLVSEHECLSHIESLDASVKQALKPSADNETHLPNEQMLRALHTLTGSAQSIGATHVVAIAQPLQRASLALHREGRYFNAEQTRTIGDLVLALRRRLKWLSGGEPIDDSALETEKKLNDLLEQTKSDTLLPVNNESSESALTIGSQVSSLSDVFANEASLILDQLGEIIRHKPFDVTCVTHALALLHTLKGSARVAGKKSICDCAHAMENDIQLLATEDEQLAAIKKGYRLLQGYQLQFMTRQVSEKSTGGNYLSRKLPASTDEQLADADPHKLLELATSLTVHQARVSDELERLKTVCDDFQSGTERWRELRHNGDLSDSPAFNEMIADMETTRLAMIDALQQTQRQQLQSNTLGASLQHQLVRAQFVRFDQIRGRLTNIIDDIATHCGVSARLHISGGELMLDRRIYQRLIAPLEHLACNAVVHGIEPAERRSISGKAATGLIRIELSMDGTELVLCFSDDGRGVSEMVMEALRSELDHRGTPADSEIQALLFRAGFSSLDNADVVAGHGLGLSAVNTLVEQLDGRVQLHAIGAQGFSITMRIPQQLVVNQVILVQSEERLYGIPVAQTRSVQLAAEGSSTVTEESDSNVSAEALSTLLGKPAPRQAKNKTLATPSLWVDVAGESFAIEVDKVIGYRELLIQNLGPQLDSLKVFSAGSVLSSGEQVLIIDLSELPGKTAKGQYRSLRIVSDDYQPTALVVDDSPTSRQMSQSFLQSRGIGVRTCRDGLEALENLSAGFPQIMLIDLEMPRMDGFTLIRRIRALYGDAVPAFIVASSHDDAPKRDMARSLGAVMFLAKPYTEKCLQDAVQAAGLRLPDLTIA